MAFGDTRQILFEFVGDASKLKRSAGEASGALDGATASSSKLSGAMGAVKAAAPAMAAAAGVAAAAWVAGGLRLAESAQLIERSFDKTFGDEGAALLERNEELRQAMGLTEAEFQQVATAIGSVNVSLGESQGEAAATSEKMIRIAADLAAFRGEVDQAPQALSDIQGALAGSAESMDKWGIELNAAAIKQRALADTGKATEAELTALEERTAALALIEERAALATGSMSDAMATGATDANEFEARMADVQTRVGESLLPLKRLLGEALLVLAEVLEALAPALTVFGDLIAGLAPILRPVIELVRYFAIGLKGIIDFAMEAEHQLNRFRDMVRRVGDQLRSAFSWTPPQWMQNLGIKGFHSGGVVPGAPGTDQLIMAQAGERVVPRNTASSSAGNGAGGGGGGGGVVINITAGVGDPVEIGRQVADALEAYTRVNGPIDL